MTFKFSLISDMHVDFPQPKTPYADLEEWVIVAGDTSNGLGGAKFLNKLKNKGHKVFAVDGNHEHYANLSQNRRQLDTECQFYNLAGQPPLAENPFSGFMIVGCNGWYPVSDESSWQGYMHDSHSGALSADHVNTLAVQHAEYIARKLNDHEGKAVVVTHTAPCLDTLNPQYDGHFSNEWYWNPYLGAVLKAHASKILVWCHGHTHAAADKIVDGVRVVCNPRGYPGENPKWKPLTVEVSA